VALVLLVDDEEAISSVVAMLLELKAHRVVVAANGADALHAAKQQPPDVVVTDLMMPVMDGLALCRELERDPALKLVPVVMMSAATKMLEEAHCDGDHRLRKPFEAAELFAIVDAALGRNGR
jgi:CheY-like chemotaxis protein